MVLHQARVVDAVVGGWRADTALGLLEDDGEDEPVVDLGLLCDLLDGQLQVVDLLGRVVLLAELGARFAQDGLVVLPHVVERRPARDSVSGKAPRYRTRRRFPVERTIVARSASQ